MNGAKQDTEAMAFIRKNKGVEERSLGDTSLTVRTGVVPKEVRMLA